MIWNKDLVLSNKLIQGDKSTSLKNEVGDGVSPSSCNTEALLFSASKDEVGCLLRQTWGVEKLGARILRQETRTSEVMKRIAIKWRYKEVDEEKHLVG